MNREYAASESEHSLASQAWRRASRLDTPKTMTPWEWQQWYAEHGVPATHRTPERELRPWWKRLLGRR